MGDRIIFDSETTGLLKPSASDIAMQPFITEIYALRVDDNLNPVRDFYTLVKPPIPIPEETIKITGITDETVKDAPSFIEVVDGIIDIFHGCEISVAHNLPFDLGVLRWELERHDLQFKFPWSPVQHCTVELSYPIKNKNIRLGVLHEIATGRKHEELAHRADEDVNALFRCYKWLIKEGFVK